MAIMIQPSTMRRPLKDALVQVRRSAVGRPRHASSQPPAGTQFYRNRQLEVFANRESKRLSLRQLVFHGRAMNDERLIMSANYVRMELPVRVAHRIRDMQALPYVVVTQENVAQVYELYWDAFEKFRRFPPINNLEDNARFCDFLRDLLSLHSRVIPMLALGLSLSSKHLNADDLDAFVRRMLISRISRRVLVEHHIALSASHQSKNPAGRKNHVGIIVTDLNVKASIERCINILKEAYASDNDQSEGPPLDFPNIQVDGHADTRFSYIKEHLDYIILELLNNAVRFTQQFAATNGKPIGTIRATIVASPNDVHLRISDNGGGLPVRDARDLFSFSHFRNSTRLEQDRIGALRTAGSTQGTALFGFGTVAEQLARFLPNDNPADAAESGFPNPASSTVGNGNPRQPARIGLGLPMSNIYTTYFGGSLDLMSLDGWGTDVYLRLPKLGTNLEGVDV
ncbi:alpha-ketoacid dehydrogenase kinase N-terminal domain-containing protein [Clavulina sp. PMI_390]|nr:alpha-ketoacid dehydrogenase kinase N-terminal domain-containing protein [Clavulina sp. PMI_390]